MKYVPGKGLCGVPGRAILFFFFLLWPVINQSLNKYCREKESCGRWN